MLINWRKLPPEKLAAILLIGGFSILGFSDNLILLIEKEAGLWQFHFFRSIFAIPFLIVVAKLFEFSIWPKNLSFVSLRTLLVTIAILLYFGSLPIMPLAVAAAGLFTSPIFVLIFSSLLFKEKVGLRRITVVLIGATGVWLILEPNAPEFTFLSLIPICAGAVYALNNITTRRLCSEESPLALVAFFYLALGLCGATGVTIFSHVEILNTFKETSPFFFSGWKTVSWAFYFYTFIHAIFSTISVAMITRAYQIAQTSYITVFDYSFVIFIGIGGWLFWDQKLSLSNILGILIIVLAGTFISAVKPPANEATY